MDRALKIKLFFIFALFITALFFHKEILNAPLYVEYHYDNLRVMISSICFGVIFSTAIYNLALSRYLKSLVHLYYALAQLATLLFLINLDSLNISPFDEIFGIKNSLFFDISQIAMLVFSLLFIREFIASYSEKKLDRLINIIIYIALADLLITLIFSKSIITKLIPIFIPIWLVLSEAWRKSKNKDLPFYYLILGWSIVILIVALEYLGAIKYFGVAFPFLHIALAMDSVILSLAISYKFKLLDDERARVQNLLLQQSRLASMGEMISIIAHQWRQPLNFLSFSLMGIKKRCDDEKVLELIENSDTQLQHMSKTIDHFREFYSPSKSKGYFDAKEAILRAIEISMKDVKLCEKEPMQLYGNQNEFEQVILNIIKNSFDIKKDALVQICIDRAVISIKDDCGGIKEQNLQKIFEPYFSTKNSSDGIGLYIAKMIIEQEMKGVLEVKNKENGVEFTIQFS